MAELPPRLKPRIASNQPVATLLKRLPIAADNSHQVREESIHAKPQCACYGAAPSGMGNVQSMSNNCSVGFHCGLLDTTRVPQVLVKTLVG
jgi:hypothetical protein